jgi:hypothetical protein
MLKNADCQLVGDKHAALGVGTDLLPERRITIDRTKDFTHRHVAKVGQLSDALPLRPFSDTRCAEE